jgi:hypothetical protein
VWHRGERITLDRNAALRLSTELSGPPLHPKSRRTTTFAHARLPRNNASLQSSDLGRTTRIGRISGYPGGGRRIPPTPIGFRNDEHPPESRETPPPLQDFKSRIAGAPPPSDRPIAAPRAPARALIKGLVSVSVEKICAENGEDGMGCRDRKRTARTERSLSSHEGSRLAMVVLWDTARTA